MCPSVLWIATSHEASLLPVGQRYCRRPLPQEGTPALLLCTVCLNNKNLGVLDLVSQICDVVLMNVYLDLGNSGGSGFRNGGYMNQGRKMGRSVYEQPGDEVDGSYHSKEGSK
jgi:hypothetical protein